MKIIKSVFLLLLCVLTNAKAQNASLFQAKQAVIQNFELLDTLKKQYLIDYDTFMKVNASIKKSICNWIEIGALNDFQLNVKGEVKFVISDDKKIGVVSWNTNLGGTMIDFAAIIGYQTPDGLYHAKRMEQEFQGTVENDKDFYTNIYSLKNKYKKTIYLLASQGQGSTLTPYYSLDSYLIEDQLMSYGNLFEGNPDGLFVAFDYTDPKNRNVAFVDLGFKFLKKGLYIRKPIAEKNGGFTGRYEVYKFDGAKYNFLIVSSYKY